MIKNMGKSCTTILAGKKATLNGATLISRNEDGHDDLNPQKFVIVTPEKQPRHYQSVIGGCEFDLPENPLRYSSNPDANPEFGVWAGAGINSANVAMSGTETITTNPRILGLDPYVENGLGEEDFVTVTLPYIHSAREGVARLGQLLETYGTYEPNGIAFSDHDEVWWLETIGGHHWAAVRIPDDAYVIAPNRMNIDSFDFSSADTMSSSGLQTLADKINPDFGEGYNLRHIFGSSLIKDTIYNNPRTWYGQNYFGNKTDDPQNQDLPFICHADRKITVEDVKFVLSSHYENTEFDPYGTTNTAADKKHFRPIGLNRNMNVHILEIRNDVPEEMAGVHWLGFAANTFNSVVPFYANVADSPVSYRNTGLDFDADNMYWLSAATSLLGDSNYSLYVDLRDSFELTTYAAFHEIQNATDSLGSGADLSAANEKLAAAALSAQTELFGKMVKLGSKHMKLKFSLQD